MGPVLKHRGVPVKEAIVGELSRCQDQQPVLLQWGLGVLGEVGGHHLEQEEEVEFVREQGRLQPRLQGLLGLEEPAVGACGGSILMTAPVLRLALSLFSSCLFSSSLVCSCSTSGENTTGPSEINKWKFCPVSYFTLLYLVDSQLSFLP